MKNEHRKIEETSMPLPCSNFRAFRENLDKPNNGEMKASIEPTDVKTRPYHMASVDIKCSKRGSNSNTLPIIAEYSKFSRF